MVPEQYQRRLVVDGDRLCATLAYQAPLSILNARNGQLVVTISETDAVKEILASGDRVLVHSRAPGTDAADRRGDRNSQSSRLMAIDGPEYARRETEEIQASLAQETGGSSELFAPGMRYALLIGLLLALFNHWTGWSVIGGRIPRLFDMSGMEDRARAILQFAVTYGFMGLLTASSL